MRIHQVMYDYVWDRWGIFVGTYRAAWVIASTVISILASYWSNVLTGGSLPNFLFWSILNIVIVWHIILKRHMTREWEWQEKDKLKVLNRLAMREQPMLVSRVFVCVFLIGFTALLSSGMDGTYDMLRQWLGMIIFMQWIWAKTVMVKERDPSRFMQRKLAYAGGRA